MRLVVKFKSNIFYPTENLSANNSNGAYKVRTIALAISAIHSNEDVKERRARPPTAAFASTSPLRSEWAL